VPKQRGWPT